MEYQNNQYNQFPQAPQSPQGKGMAIASMVCGIVAIPLSWVYVGTLVAIVGLVLGILSSKKLKEQGAPAGMALAGIICSCVGLAIAILVTACIACIACNAANYVTNPLYWQ